MRWWPILILWGCSEATDVAADGNAADAALDGPRPISPDAAAEPLEAGPTPDARPDAADLDLGQVDVPDGASPDLAAPDVEGAVADAADPDAEAPDLAVPDAAEPDACPAPGTYYPDADEDGFGDADGAIEACAPPLDHIEQGGDCDDADPAVNPDQSERCNGVDDDCNGAVDDRPVDGEGFFEDRDGDGVGDPNIVRRECARPEGFADVAGDCNDDDAQIGACPLRCSVARRCLGAGECLAPADCDGLTLCEAGRCVPGSPCGGEAFGLERVQPDLLVVLDRSCSMRRRVDGVRKWQASVDAIDAMTTEFEETIRFGLSLFPDKGDNANCRQADLVIPIADDAAPRVRALLTAALDSDDRYWPDGPCVTNIDTAMEQAGTDPALQERGYVMLITDGRQAGCNRAGGDEGTTLIIEALAARGVTTFVVGFGGEVDPDQLDTFARAGGAPRAGERAFYQADDPAGLLAQLREIAQQITDCTFELDAPPPDDAQIAAYFDDVELVPRDPGRQEGWDYDAAANTVTFFGQACDRIDQGLVQDVDVVFGCDSRD